MTNRAAVIIAIIVLGLFLADQFWLHIDLPLFIGRKLDALIEYLAFWR